MSSKNGEETGKALDIKIPPLGRLLHMSQLVTTNKNKIKVVQLPKCGGKREEKLFPIRFSNIFLCARKNSGKTNIIYNILEQCTNKHTQVLFFVSTIDKDPMYKKIIEMLDDKKIAHLDNTHFILEDGSNLITEFFEGPSEAETEEVPEEQKPIQRKVIFGNEEKVEKKSRKRKPPEPDYILVFDDLGSDLRNKTVTQLLKKNRHYRCKVVMSSQYATDLEPAAVKQLDYLLVFGGLPKDKIEHLYKFLNLSVDLDEFEELYHQAIQQRYDFLYVDITKNVFKRNFG